MNDLRFIVTISLLSGLQSAAAGPEQRSRQPVALTVSSDYKWLYTANRNSGSISVIATTSLELIAVNKIPGHNIRGLAISSDGQQLLASQQELNPLARSTFDDVHWGNMISNVLVSFSLDDICDSEVDVLSHRVAFQLGEPGNAEKCYSSTVDFRTTAG